MKTLYVSDLDGTLLNQNACLSEYTKEIMNKLIGEGMLFSYATARSSVSAEHVTSGLNIKLPVIIYNGTFILDTQTGEHRMSNYFNEDAMDLLKDLFKHDIFPIVYSHMDGEERFAYIPEKASRGIRAHVGNRKGDRRTHPVERNEQLYEGKIFCINCIDEPEKLEPLYEKYRNLYHCAYYVDIYSKEQWLEIMPKAASKARAALELKKYLNCDRLVVFGDQKNDMDMFKAADECYAVSNAADELKALATGIIDSNNEDGVAEWLLKHFKDEGESGLYDA